MSPLRACQRDVVLTLIATLTLTGCVGPQVGRTLDTSNPLRQTNAVIRARQAGPFYESVQTADGTTRTSLRPLLYTHIDSPQSNASITEVLWPLYASHTLDERLNWRFLSVLGRNADTSDPTSAYHLWAFPLWFQGRTPAGDNYAALFPFGGTVRDFLMFDRFSFTLWPLWSTAEKAGIQSTYILWPLYSHDEGTSLHSTRLFPFWGHSSKSNEWDRSFLLWPLWNQASYYHDGQPDGSAWSLFLVAGHTDRPSVEAWQIIPPFFQVSRGRGRFQGNRQILAPWPLVRITDHGDTHKRNFYPFYATTWTSNSVQTSVLWPFFSHHGIEAAGFRRDDWSFAPIFHRTRVHSLPNPDSDTAPAPLRSYTRLWPLFSHVDEKGGSYFRLLDFSLHRRVGPLERNLLQFPVLYTHGTTPDAREDEALWGLFRWKRTPASTLDFQLWPLFRKSRDTPDANPNWSLLYGLYGREQDPKSSSRKTRFLWVFTL